MDSSVVVDPGGAGRRVASRDSRDSAAAAYRVLAVACVGEHTLPALVDWARSRRVSISLCFTAIAAVRLLQREAVGLTVLGEPPDAPLSETVRALRRLDSRMPILHMATTMADRRPGYGLPSGVNTLLLASSTHHEVAEALERLWCMADGADDLLTVGPICLRSHSRILMVDGVSVDLTGKRLDLLAYLMKFANRVVPKEELALAVVGSLRGDPRRIAKEVCAIRAALGRAAAMVETCSGGYRLSSSTLPR